MVSQRLVWSDLYLKQIFVHTSCTTKRKLSQSENLSRKLIEEENSTSNDRLNFCKKVILKQYHFVGVWDVRPKTRSCKSIPCPIKHGTFNLSFPQKINIFFCKFTAEVANFLNSQFFLRNMMIAYIDPYMIIDKILHLWRDRTFT